MLLVAQAFCGSALPQRAAHCSSPWWRFRAKFEVFPRRLLDCWLCAPKLIHPITVGAPPSSCRGPLGLWKDGACSLQVRFLPVRSSMSFGVSAEGQSQGRREIVLNHPPRWFWNSVAAATQSSATFSNPTLSDSTGARPAYSRKMRSSLRSPLFLVHLGHFANHRPLLALVL